jgi:hypothetical protein
MSTYFTKNPEYEFHGNLLGGSIFVVGNKYFRGALKGGGLHPAPKSKFKIL